MSISTVTTKTMLSTEIAALTNKKHSHVMRDIRTIVEQLKDSPNLDSGFAPAEYKADNGKNEPCYQLLETSRTGLAARIVKAIIRR